MKQLISSVLLVLAAAGLAACGSDSDTQATVPEQPAPGGGNPPATPAPTATCQTDFNPERVKAGENCAPVTGSFCQVPPGLLPDQLSCDGVVVNTQPISGGEFNSTYIALRSSSRPPQAIVLALHYLNARAGAFANIVRLPELAKARDVVVLVPQAPVATNLLTPPSEPAPLPLNLAPGSRWPTNPVLEPVGRYVSFLDAVVADARTRFGGGSLPLYVAGLSNGGGMAFLYACAAADRVEAIMTVAGLPGSLSLLGCVPIRPVGSVVVHGTADVVSPYAGRPGVTASAPQLHAFFKSANGCAAESSAQIPANANDSLSVQFLYTAPCNNLRRSVLTSIISGGHNWPGEEVSPQASNAGLLGLKSTQFDATLQGYDLLRYAAGH